jgi:hypothetical protein
MKPSPIQYDTLEWVTPGGRLGRRSNAMPTSRTLTVMERQGWIERCDRWPFWTITQAGSKILSEEED